MDKRDVMGGEGPAQEEGVQDSNAVGNETPLADVLERVVDFFGTRLVEYVTCAEIEMLESLEVPEAAVSAVAALGKMVPEDGSVLDPQVRSWILLRFTGVRGEEDLVASEMRGNGSVDIPGEWDGADALIRCVARRLYPAMVAPPPAETPIGRTTWAWAQVARAEHADPICARLRSQLLEQDPRLDKVFGCEEGAAVAMGTSTGNQRNLRRDEVGAVALLAAARRPVSSMDEFERRASESLELLLRALSGETLMVDGFIAMSGVRLPEGVQADFGSVVVRAMTAQDRDWINESRLGGFEVEPSPELDRCSVIVEHTLPFRASTKRGDGSRINGERFEGNLELNSVRLLFTKLSLGLLLATSGSQRPQLSWEWRGVLDPVQGLWDTQKYLDPTFLKATVDLTAKEFQDWAYWFRALDQLPDAKLEVAMSRLVRAASERADPADVLVDSVIAWENMFGGGGELSFRVTAAMAVLIASRRKDRQGLQNRLSKIYALRSGVVHGSKTVGSEQRTVCNDALELALRAFKRMLKDYPELVGMDSSERSVRLLLGG